MCGDCTKDPHPLSSSGRRVPLPEWDGWVWAWMTECGAISALSLRPGLPAPEALLLGTRAGGLSTAQLCPAPYSQAIPCPPC